MIINFIGHGFQWFQNANPNPAPFQVENNTAIRLYINAGALYGAQNTPRIITNEREGNMNNIIEHFEDGAVCPELLLIRDGGTWNDIIADNRFQYLPEFRCPNVGGHIVRIREIAFPNEPREFALSPEQNNQVFSLSWLVAYMRAIMEQYAMIGHENPPNENEEIILRWLVCRQELQANNLENIPERLNEELQEPNRFNELIR